MWSVAADRRSMGYRQVNQLREAWEGRAILGCGHRAIYQQTSDRAQEMSRKTAARKMRRGRGKRLRAQPRKATPPVCFRSDDGDRSILLVDEGFVTQSFVRTNSRQPIFLKLGPGLVVLMESRRVTKRRYPQLRIEVARAESLATATTTVGPPAASPSAELRAGVICTSSK